MDNIIKLDNNKYGLAIDGYIKENNIKYIRLDNLHLIQKYEGNVLFYVDFNSLKELNDYKYIIKKMVKHIKIYNKCKTSVGIIRDDIIIIGVVKNYNKDDKYHNDLINAINAVLINEYKERYEYIYDKICEYLDNEFITKNLCGFKNDKCIAKRDTNCTMGCCHQFKSIFSGKMTVCKYLLNNTCTAHCISCKLFTCDYLEKQGVKFKIKKILLADCFFNIAQKLIIKTKLFTKKEDILRLIFFLHI